MIEKKLVNVNLSSIDLNDQFYCLGAYTDIAPLIKSIREAGLITPPILQKTQNGYNVVAGFKRVEALKVLNIEQCDAFVVEESASKLDVFLLAVRDRLSHGRLDAIELSLFIHKLQYNLGVDRKNIIKTYVPLAGYGRNPRVYELYSRLYLLSADWRQMVRDEQTPVDLANEILDRVEEERGVFLNLFQSMRLGKNRQREFVLLISDVAKRAGISVTEIFELPPVNEVLNDNKRTPSQRADRLKQWLWRERYPRYAEAQQNFDALIKEQKLPDGLSIQPPPYFEGERFSASFTFSSEKEFQDHLQALTRLTESGATQKIIDMP